MLTWDVKGCGIYSYCWVFQINIGWSTLYLHMTCIIGWINRSTQWFKNKSRLRHLGAICQQLWGEKAIRIKKSIVVFLPSNIDGCGYINISNHWHYITSNIKRTACYKICWSWYLHLDRWFRNCIKNKRIIIIDRIVMFCEDKIIDNFFLCINYDWLCK